MSSHCSRLTNRPHMHMESQFTNFHTTVMHETIHTDDAPTTLSTRNALINTTIHKEWLVGGSVQRDRAVCGFCCVPVRHPRAPKQIKTAVYLHQPGNCVLPHTDRLVAFSQSSHWLPSLSYSPLLHLLSNGSRKLMFLWWRVNQTSFDLNTPQTECYNIGYYFPVCPCNISRESCLSPFVFSCCWSVSSP